MTDETQSVSVDIKSLPKWLQAAALLGVPSVISMFMVYVLTMGIVSRVTRIEETQATQTANISTLISALKTREQNAAESERRIDDSFDKMERIVRNVCMVAANTVEERTVCGAP